MSCSMTSFGIASSSAWPEAGRSTGIAGTAAWPPAGAGSAQGTSSHASAKEAARTRRASDMDRAASFASPYLASTREPGSTLELVVSWAPDPGPEVFRMRTRVPAVSPLLLSLVLLVAARDVDTKRAPADLTASDINTCVQQNFPDDSMIQTVKMLMKDRMGVERLLEADMFWEKDQATRLSKVLLEFDNPPELRGAAVLLIEKKPMNDMFMYLPELGKTRRITTQMVNGNMMGTDFTYEDFSRLQGMMSNLQTERLPDEQYADRPVFVTLARPAPDTGSDYDRIRSLIDQKTCVPLRVDFLQKGGE